MTNSRLLTCLLVVVLSFGFLSVVAARAQEKCPQTQVSGDQPIALTAKACSDDAAKKKIYKELIKKARKVREDKHAGACKGKSCEAGDCILSTPIAAGELTCDPAEVDGCEDGIGSACTFVGPVRAECLCAI